ncbi:MAG: MBL fold metallo-hydrolase, partial [Holophagales bacterium]|nr:MBL fold metallo-hydrolase [Holophagales bacterium]
QIVQAVEMIGIAIDGLDSELSLVPGSMPTLFDGRATGWIEGDPPLRDIGVLQLSMVDVQQGDGLILETPPTPGELHGRIVFLDGGDNKLFARHVASRYAHLRSSPAEPLSVDAMIVTHGDADHFDGLNDLRRSEGLTRCRRRKRVFVHPRRIFHNGLVKTPARRDGRTVPEHERFGRSVVGPDGRTFAVELFEDPRHAEPENTGRNFGFWNQSLDHWQSRGPIELRRVDAGMDPDQLFDFLAADGVSLELLGPVVEQVHDPVLGQEVPALPFLFEPPETALIHLERGANRRDKLSASHTINGHSLTFRLRFGDVRFLFTGDLNQEAMAGMLARVGEEALEAEILKAPHHGSADFDLRTLEKVRPVVALVSSGDESGFKEHIHPRATLMSALGRAMHGETGVILCTELAAFFAIKQYCHSRRDLADYFEARRDRTFTGDELYKMFRGASPCPGDDMPRYFYGFERSNFGIVHIRTDGRRVLVFTHSGKKGLNEAYRFEVSLDSGQREITFADDVVTR